MPNKEPKSGQGPELCLSEINPLIWNFLKFNDNNNNNNNNSNNNGRIYIALYLRMYSKRFTRYIYIITPADLNYTIPEPILSASCADAQTLTL
jgi:hypothetical protein